MIIQSKKVWATDKFIPAQIEIKNKKIHRIYKYNEQKVDRDFSENRIVPGFIDIHIHGADGFDTNDAVKQGLIDWKLLELREGVTSFLPTTVTQSKEVLTAALKNVKAVYDENHPGAEILGIHFEGPYLDMTYKGAQPEQHIKTPSVEEFKEYQKASGNLIKIVTIASEHDENFELTRYLAETGVIASLGHSSATIEEARMAVLNGVKSMTHIYNGMSPFTHRKNNLMGAAMRFRDVYGEVICDGNHSTFDALNIIFSLKDKDKVIMISDALMAKGKPVGSKFIFGGNEIEIYPDGSAHLTETKGLSGSTLKINEGLRNLVEYANVDFARALASCTINPATLLGFNDRLGKLQVGYDADIVILNDDYNVLSTFSKGHEYEY
ncbi:MAG: N-acetylglucosamine-6-phosphate deacetylase [Clostridiales bacterium]|nr:MAG: N-acetylglucosamine-6-phosphate deacetylase [Clostridiales bacterium]